MMVLSWKARSVGSPLQRFHAYTVMHAIPDRYAEEAPSYRTKVLFAAVENTVYAILDYVIRRPDALSVGRNGVRNVNAR